MNFEHEEPASHARSSCWYFFFQVVHAEVVWSDKRCSRFQYMVQVCKTTCFWVTVQSIIIFNICHIVFLSLQFLLSTFIPLMTGPAFEMIHIFSWHHIFIVCENLCVLPFLCNSLIFSSCIFMAVSSFLSIDVILSSAFWTFDSSLGLHGWSHKECLKNVSQEYPTRVSFKSVPAGCFES